jgi:hypothetical protein
MMENQLYRSRTWSTTITRTATRASSTLKKLKSTTYYDTNLLEPHVVNALTPLHYLTPTSSNDLAPSIPLVGVGLVKGEQTRTEDAWCRNSEKK